MGLVYRDDVPGIAPKPRRRIAWRGALFMLACLMPVALICAPPRWPDSPGGVRVLPSGIGYKAAADRMAGEKLLKLVPVPRQPGQPPMSKVVIDPSRIAANPAAFGDCRDRWQKITWLPWFESDPAAPCAAVLARYTDETYLALDMRQVSQWDIADGKVSALLPNSHVLVSAGGSRDVWRGEISYRTEPGRAPTDLARATLIFSEVGSNRTVFRFTDGQGKRELGLGALMTSEAGAGEGSRLGLKLGDTSSELFGHAAISFQRLGRAVLIGLPPALGDARLYIDGRTPEPLTGRQEKFDGTRYLVMRPDQYLTIEDGKTGRRLTMQLAETPGAISEMSGNRRIRETSLFDVAQRLEQSGISGNHESSIVGRLHLDLQRRLATAMTAGTRPGAPPASWRGAVLLMDGLTGEIAAAATFPSEVDQLAPSDRQNPDRIKWLKINFNFQPLTIGSAAKVPFATAIVEAHPELLKRPPIAWNPVFTALDGKALQLPKSKKTMANDGGNGQPPAPTVSFNNFITYSNNEFALTLMRRGTIADTRAGNWGSPAAWPANLWKFGCVVPYGLTEQGGDFGWSLVEDDNGRKLFPPCSPYLWRDRNDQAIGDRPIATAPLYLQMGMVRNDFTDFYLSMLGGSRSLWTTANLGQAYARLLSGRAVSPRLSVTDTPAKRGSLSIRPGVWTEVSAGMRNVLGIGTARALGNGVLKDSGPVFFYAKTGTPDVDQPAGEQGHVIVLLAARTRSGNPPAAPGDICGLRVMVINLQRDASLALDLAKLLLATGEPFREWMSAPCRSSSLF